MDKVDLKKTLDAYQATQGEFRFVDVPPMQYLMVNGHGDPNSEPAYAEAIAAVYPVAYALKFAGKKDLGLDHVVMPLEALWWAEDMTAFTSARDKSRWSWTLMVMVPEWATATIVEAATAKAAARRPSPALDRLRFEMLHEGRCVQTLHVGSYDDEGPVLAHLHDEVVPRAGLRLTGRHHEIYLSDARRVEPARLRTILRQPVESA